MVFWRVALWLKRRVAFGAALVVAAVVVCSLVALWPSSGPHLQWLPWIPRPPEKYTGNHPWRTAALPETIDQHPIRGLMHQADSEFKVHDDNSRSKTFADSVAKYRRRYGRHPPPGFKEWYKFARERNVHDIDDFQQIHDDLRPFWAIPPAQLRHYAAHASDDYGHLVATISLRDHQVFQETWGWRSETFIKMLATVAPWLPDMDIPINRMDQPRVVVPWEDMQEYLKTEEKTRTLQEEGVTDGFSTRMDGFWTPRPLPPRDLWFPQWNPFWMPHEHQESSSDPHPVYGWFPYHGEQYMNLASMACPPESHARNDKSLTHLAAAESSYKHEMGGFITNFNISSDLCTVGPQLKNLHGMLYASTSTLATHKLIPIFGECKLNVNNDILFPANMYWKRDRRYQYNGEQDVSWHNKDDTMIWRGSTSGGTTTGTEPNRWQTMHRQRLVQLTNSTELLLDSKNLTILALNISSTDPKTYTATSFSPVSLAKGYTDIGFTQKTNCVPDCSFYDSKFAMLNKTKLTDTFKSKYLIDVDGMSFSGRWRAFLQSRSLGLKATIFREWHDSRLWAWRHFVPVDNRYGDLYSLLAYFAGFNGTSPASNGDDAVTVPRHDFEAHKIAHQGRDWAEKVLRREDMEIYLFRLLLEYGRIIDDNRDHIGLVGDGAAEMREFDRRTPAV